MKAVIPWNEPTEFVAWYRRERLGSAAMTDEQFLAFLNSPIPHCNANSVQFIDQKRAWMAAIESTKQSAERESERPQCPAADLYEAPVKPFGSRG